MKRTSSAGAGLKSASETILPLVSGRRKSGALVPSGSMADGVRDISLKQRVSREEQISGNVKMPCQGPHMIEGQFAFAAQNHRAEVAAAAQKARKICRAHASFFQ